MDKAQFRNSLKDILNHLADTAYLENSSLASLLLSEEESRGGSRIQLLRNKIKKDQRQRTAKSAPQPASSAL